jgi:hypothetical protein
MQHIFRSPSSIAQSQGFSPDKQIGCSSNIAPALWELGHKRELLGPVPIPFAQGNTWNEYLIGLHRRIEIRVGIGPCSRVPGRRVSLRMILFHFGAQGGTKACRRRLKEFFYNQKFYLIKFFWITFQSHLEFAFVLISKLIDGRNSDGDRFVQFNHSKIGVETNLKIKFIK